MDIEPGEYYEFKTQHEAEPRLLRKAARQYIISAATSPIPIPDGHAQSLIHYLLLPETKRKQFNVKVENVDAFRNSLESLMPNLDTEDMNRARAMVDLMNLHQTNIIIPDQLPEDW